MDVLNFLIVTAVEVSKHNGARLVEDKAAYLPYFNVKNLFL
jgi:hypothetical protein